MKKIVLLMLLCSVMSLGYKRSDSLGEELGKIEREQSLRTQKLEIRKSKLEDELSKLQENYNSRIDMVEKLREDSEVRWNRDEYREILKKYEVVQEDLEKEISKREKEISLINKGLGIIEEM